MARDTIKDPIRDPHYWRERAAATRAKADNYGHRPNKEKLLKIAEEYDRLAERAEQRQTADKPKD